MGTYDHLNKLEHMIDDMIYENPDLYVKMRLELLALHGCMVDNEKRYIHYTIFSALLSTVLFLVILFTCIFS